MPWRAAREDEDGINAVSCGCWIWTGRTVKGTPVIRTREAHTTAARYYWTREHGKPVPEGKCLKSLCGERLCVNPSHREPVTEREKKYRTGEVILGPEIARQAHAAAKRGASHSQIARAYGVSKRTAGRLANGTYSSLVAEK